LSPSSEEELEELESETELESSDGGAGGAF
jgi:hypothetical protein